MIAYISGREKSGIQKSKDFILEFNNQLNNIKFEYTKKHINIIGKTTFFDEENMNYRLFDFEEFNALLSLEYERFYLNPVLEKNYLYNLMNNHLNIFLQDALEKKIFISFFFEVLRKARLRQNIFDLIKIESEIPEKIYLNCREVYIHNTKKILKNYINLLAEYKILRKNQNILLEFFCSSELENLINLSFDTPKLGNQNGFGVADTKFFFEFALDHQKELIFKENDFMFHYILAGHTNCITLYSKKINNIYLDRLIKRHDFYQYI
ncbi:MAG: hypothetical protein EOP33_07520 [Rickettsiaceae bacterium]|nr:MAG: hypothetical protein EOP33_07520 [Rickettsiaceae bacterium]